MNMTKLCNDNLGAIGASVPVPSYDRSKLTPGIVHIGLGNFHRAHQAWYLHRLFQRGLNQDWAIIGAGVRPYDGQMREKMRAQDYLTTLIELDPSGKSAEVVGSMIDYLPVEEGNGPLIEQMADPAIRIVALTVTEGGYYIDPATKGFDENHPDIQHDVKNPERPRTAFGAMVAALKLRRERGVGPFTGQCCDNLLGNGRILRQTVVSLARLSDPELADWIDANCSFPNAMVDCIVPATGPKELALVKEFGIDDQVPVTHERFRHWVMEDDFCAGRPDWDQAGAIFTDRVHDFERMKIRLLNGSHQVIAGPGELLGIETIAEAMGQLEDPRPVSQGGDRGDRAPRQAGTRFHSGGIRGPGRPALLQPGYRGHHPPGRLRWLQPASGIHRALDPRRAGGGHPGGGPGPGFGDLGALLPR